MGGGQVSVPSHLHGTTGAYTNHACRCAACRAAWVAYNRKNRKRRLLLGICIQCPQPRYKKHVRCRQHYDAQVRRTDKRLHGRKSKDDRGVAW